MNYYLDTDICIFALKGQFPSIKQRIEVLSPDHIKIPAIVKAELMLGAQKSSNLKPIQQVVEHFLAPFEVIPFCDRCADVYPVIRHHVEKIGKVIDPYDLLVASTVLANHGTLITHNTKEFLKIPNLKLQDWTSHH